MSERDQNHGRIALPIPIGLRGRDQPFNLWLSQAVSPWRNSPNNSAWRHQPQIAFSHVKSPIASVSCPNIAPSWDSSRAGIGVILTHSRGTYPRRVIMIGS